jgi:hypothetical protein
MFAKRCCLTGAVLVLAIVSGPGSAVAAPAQNGQPVETNASRVLGGDAQKMVGHTPQMSNQRPAGFEAPVYINNVIESKYMEAPGGNATKSAVFKTKDAPATVFQWYQSALRSTGWEIEPTKALTQPNPLQQSGNLFMARAHKDGNSLMFYCAHTKGTDYTRINVSILPTPPGAR